ncbi:MAG: hypothetical protein MJZ76_11055, partial [Bacteroidales bacterium]|nr:hypothetical protein [Bacteroidales bacterium]
QSRYYDPSVCRFVSADSTDYLGSGGSVLSFNLFEYCEGNSNSLADSDGHLPLFIWSMMHNAVLHSAQMYLFSLGIITMSEVRTCNLYGIYNGRMDIFSFLNRMVWEVKRNNASGKKAGLAQLNRYTSSYVFSLFHLFPRIKMKPVFGKTSVYGLTCVSSNLVIYWSDPAVPALILYEPLSKAQVFSLFVKATLIPNIELINMISSLPTRIREKAQTVLASILSIINESIDETQQFVNAMFQSFDSFSLVMIVVIALLLVAALVGVAA